MGVRGGHPQALHLFWTSTAQLCAPRSCILATHSSKYNNVAGGSRTGRCGKRQVLSLSVASTTGNALDGQASGVPPPKGLG